MRDSFQSVGLQVVVHGRIRKFARQKSSPQRLPQSTDSFPTSAQTEDTGTVGFTALEELCTGLELQAEIQIETSGIVEAQEFR